MRKSYLIIVFTSFLIVLSSCASSPYAGLSEMSSEYLEKLLHIDIGAIDISGSGEQALEEKAAEMYLYLDENYKQYFTESGYESFLNNNIYSARLRFFRNNNIVSVENLKIELKSAKTEDDTVAYDYIMTYTAKSGDGSSFEFSDKGQLLFRKTADNDFRIEEDYIRYYDKKFSTLRVD